MGPEGAILGPLSVSLLACCGMLLAWGIKNQSEDNLKNLRPGRLQPDLDLPPVTHTLTDPGSKKFS